MIAVFDNVILPPIKINNSTNTRWIYKDDLDKFQREMLQHSYKLFGNFEFEGIEIWSHYQTKPEWHYDKDELLYNETGELSFPICGIIYYAKVEKLIGGNFITEDVIITPKKNRLIVFSSDTYHSVEEYIGERLSIIINPWKRKPKNYEY